MVTIPEPPVPPVPATDEPAPPPPPPLPVLATAAPPVAPVVPEPLLPLLPPAPPTPPELVEHVHADLAPFTVRVEVDGDGRRYGLDRPEVTAYSAMMLQVVNDVAAHTAWHVCENEPCGRLFARQQGRAEAGQYRERGVKYCSKNCARAQVERMRRRKRKDQANG
jgi:hypothetical protein